MRQVCFGAGIEKGMCRGGEELTKSRVRCMEEGVFYISSETTIKGEVTPMDRVTITVSIRENM